MLMPRMGRRLTGTSVGREREKKTRLLFLVISIDVNETPRETNSFLMDLRDIEIDASS